MKNNKTPGKVLLNIEFLKYSGEAFLYSFIQLLNKIWTREEIPKCWTKSIVVRIYKKGDLKLCNNNYRFINAYKIFGSTLKNKFYEY